MTKQFNGFFSRLFSSEYRHITRELKLCKKDGKKVKYKVAVSMMDTLRVYQQKSSEFNGLEEKVEAQIGTAYNNVSTRFGDLVAELEMLTKIHSTDVDFATLMTLRNQEFVARQKDFAILSDCFAKAFSKLEEAEKRVVDRYNLDEYDVRYVDLDDLVNKYQGCIDSIDKLDNWCEFVKLLNKLSELELRAFVDYAITQKIKTDNVLSAYKKAFYIQKYPRGDYFRRNV